MTYQDSSMQCLSQAEYQRLVQSWSRRVAADVVPKETWIER